MRRFIHILICCLLTLSALPSCFKDNGNYDYKDLVSIDIDDNTVPTAVVKRQQEYLVITPSVKQGADDSNLSFEWRLKDNLWAPDPATGEFIDEVIATSKNLNYLLDLPARQYHLLLYVSDKTNGVTEYRQIDLTVQTIAPQGLMVLHGDNASCDVSIVVNPKINATLSGFDQDNVQHHLFSDNNDGRKAEGAPVMVRQGAGGGGDYTYIFTNGHSGGYRTASTDLKIIGDYRSNFRDMPASEVGFQGIASWSYNELLVNNGDLYYCSQNAPNVHIPFGVKCFGLDYEAAPYIGTHRNGYVYGAFYDAKNRRFLYINYQQTILQFNAPASGRFDMNSVGKDMVYGEMGFPADFWYCVMQDGSDVATRNLYVVDLNQSVYNAQSTNGAQIIDICAATEMAVSKYFAFGTRGYVMYHATNHKVYFNNYNGDRQSALLYDVLVHYPNYEITSMQLFKTSRNSVYDSKLLFLGIYNPVTQQGMLLQFVVNETNGTFEESAPTVYGGFGRIAHIDYKWK